MRLWLHVADGGFIAFHTALVLFNCTGWIWKRTRRLHLISVCLTLFSWLVMGVFFGAGYCVCTDLHWRVREALGVPITEDSYVQFLVRLLTGLHVESDL